MVAVAKRVIKESLACSCEIRKLVLAGSGFAGDFYPDCGYVVELMKICTRS
jgi:hypothetical protein